MKKIDILLSTFNGEKYIKELIDSLMKQTITDWRLLIRDDGSLDNTIKIISEYAKNNPDKIVFAEDKEKHLGACQSFARILELADADYIMFCDQDDVWLEDKVEITFNKMQEIEREFRDKPILVHTDLKVVDQNLRIISESMWRYQKLQPERKSLNYLLVQNNVTGCTMMINKKLKELVLSIPQEAMVHDWWMALIASALGEIGIVNESTILYRQHGKNDIGAKKYSLKYFLARNFYSKKAKELFSKVLKQSKVFQKTYDERMDESGKKIVSCFSSLIEQPIYERIRSILKYRFTKYGLLRNLGFLGLILFLPKIKD